MKKQGFPDLVVKFFASYLVGRFTSYSWGSFSSPPMEANVGVGQGSALSPVLSAIYIAPIMWLFERAALNLRIRLTLISYVDDGTFVVQGTDRALILEVLRESYAIIFELFTASGLVLEHNKTELFHFAMPHDKENPTLDLGYAPFTEDTPLTPKTFWRYLGFYFDRGLNFKEHVRNYSTKALTTVKAMGMLGNSSRGLPAMEKRRLYRSCVIPIATYGFRMWYFLGARNKANVKSLVSMQWKAALWITGAFRTSPTGGVEALAGLAPIHVLLSRQARRSAFRVATLLDTHPLRSLMAEPHRKGALEHPMAMPHTHPKVRSGVVETHALLPILTERFEPCAPSARPGLRLLDRFADRVEFVLLRDDDPKTAPDTPEPPPEEKGERDFDGRLIAYMLGLHPEKSAAAEPPIYSNDARPKKQVAPAASKAALDSLFEECFDDPTALVIVTDASVPVSKRHQSVSAAHIYRGGTLIHESRWVSGAIFATDAELNAIRLGIELALQESGEITSLLVFTDLIASARRAVDPSPHSGQAHALAVCAILDPWLDADESCTIQFIQVRSAAKWGPHKLVHDFCRNLVPIPAGKKPENSIDSIHWVADTAARQSWASWLQDPAHRGYQFMMLTDLEGGLLQPTTVKGGSWLPSVSESLSLTARLVRCILGHAPIGAYFECFNIPTDSVACACGYHRQTRDHILAGCPLYALKGYPSHLFELVDFLKANPLAFASPVPQGVG